MIVVSHGSYNLNIETNNFGVGTVQEFAYGHELAQYCVEVIHVGEALGRNLGIRRQESGGGNQKDR